MLDVFLACLILTRTSLYIFGQLYLHMRRRQSKRMNERTAAGSAAASGAGSQYGRCRTYVRSELRCRRRSDRTEYGGGVAPIHRVVVKTDTHWRTDDTFQAETFVLHHERRLRRPSPSPVVPQPVISRGLSIGSGRAGGGCMGEVNAWRGTAWPRRRTPRRLMNMARCQRAGRECRPTQSEAAGSFATGCL